MGMRWFVLLLLILSLDIDSKQPQMHMGAARGIQRRELSFLFSSDCTQVLLEFALLARGRQRKEEVSGTCKRGLSKCKPGWVRFLALSRRWLTCRHCLPVFVCV